MHLSLISCLWMEVGKRKPEGGKRKSEGGPSGGFEKLARGVRDLTIEDEPTQSSKSSPSTLAAGIFEEGAYLVISAVEFQANLQACPSFPATCRPSSRPAGNTFQSLAPVGPQYALRAPVLTTAFVTLRVG